MNKSKIMIIAGEASGDLHGAHLANELKQCTPYLELRGMGGKNMQEAGVELLANISTISVCGFVEVIGYLPKIYSLFKLIKEEITRQPPDLLILIDYPTFNLRLADIAGKLNIKVLYYISPQIWAWHTSRVKKIRKNVDMMGVVFPFESEFYRKHDVPVRYVGHPLAGKVSVSDTKEKIRDRYSIKKGATVIGLLPGSRKNEIKYIFPTLIKSAELLATTLPDVQFILPLANTLTETEIQQYLHACRVQIKIIKTERYDVMSICDAVIAVSGTITLELALLEVPMVIVYKANHLSYIIAKKLVKIPWIGLCNIIAGEKIAEELIQKKANPLNIKNEILRILSDINYREEQKRQLAKVGKQLYAQKECSIASLALEVLKN